MDYNGLANIFFLDFIIILLSLILSSYLIFNIMSYRIFFIILGHFFTLNKIVDKKLMTKKPRKINSLNIYLLSS